MRRITLRYLLPTVAALGVGAAVTVAAIPGSDGVIHGCYLTSTANAPGLRLGELRIVDPSAQAPPSGAPNPNTCASDEAPISWSQQGPQGPPGPAGTNGTNGSNGVNGLNLISNLPAVQIGGSSSTPLTLTLAGLKDTIHINSFSFGVANPTTIGSSNGGGGTGRQKTTGEISITKTLDKSSPSLFQAAVSGKHYPHAILTLRKAGKDPLSAKIVFTLTDVVISSVTQGAGGGAQPLEQVALNYTKASESFQATNSNGKLLPAVQVALLPAVQK